MPDRKKNPRAPLIKLDQAIEFAREIYEQARCTEIDVDVASVALGYKDSRNGAAQTKLGTLKYYGIVEGRGKGRVAVSTDLQSYLYAPSDEEKWLIAANFLQTPAVFRAILDQFDGELPGEAVIRMFLLKQIGFVDPDKAENVISVFAASLEFVNSLKPRDENSSTSNADAKLDKTPQAKEETNSSPITDRLAASELPDGNGYHPAIPIRLRGKRMAWMSIPDDFVEADKQVLKDQIDAIWVEE